MKTIFRVLTAILVLVMSGCSNAVFETEMPDREIFYRFPFMNICRRR